MVPSGTTQGPICPRRILKKKIEPEEFTIHMNHQVLEVVPFTFFLYVCN
jgi:hypothetical protein